MEKINDEKRKKYMKEYQKANPEKFLAATLKWQAKPENQAHLKAYRKEFYRKYNERKRQEKEV